MKYIITLLLFTFGYCSYLRGNNNIKTFFHDNMSEFLGDWYVKYSNIHKINDYSGRCEKVYYYLDDNLQFKFKYEKWKHQEKIEKSGNIHLQFPKKMTWNITNDIHSIKSSSAFDEVNNPLEEDETFLQNIIYIDNKNKYMITGDGLKNKIHVLVRDYSMEFNKNEFQNVLKEHSLGSIEYFYEIPHDFCSIDE